MIQGKAGSGETSASPVRADVTRKKPVRLVLAVVLVVIAFAGFFAAAYSLHFLGLGRPDCASHPTNTPNSAYFVILVDNRGMNVGFNGSMLQSGPWPIMNATLGQMVTIHVVNVDPVGSHGFAINRYFPPSLILNSGECHDVTFTPDQLGQFRVYCWIVCSIHNFMINGVLNVNPGF